VTNKKKGMLLNVKPEIPQRNGDKKLASLAPFEKCE
jgi:hypothetical protein